MNGRGAGQLAEIDVKLTRILGYFEGDGGEEAEEDSTRTPEERAAMAERHEELLRFIERAKIELETCKRPAV